MSAPIVDFGGQSFSLDPRRAHSLAIAMDFEGPQPGFFGAPPARRKALEGGEFIGDTRQGGSCNCEVLEIIPHCNGTHTECVGHVTDERTAVHRKLGPVMVPALLLSLHPMRLDSSGESGPATATDSDPVLTRQALREAWEHLAPDLPPRALILRTLPNTSDKRQRDWMGTGSAWLTREAAEWLVEAGIEHLLVDQPSVDRPEDGGELVAHRIFWGLPSGSRKLMEARRPEASITEMIYAPDNVADGLWLLDLQYPELETDAVPSRPLLYPTIETTP